MTKNYSKDARWSWKGRGESKSNMSMREIQKKLDSGELTHKEAIELRRPRYLRGHVKRKRSKKLAFSRSGSGIDNPPSGYSLCCGIIGIVVGLLLLGILL